MSRPYNRQGRQDLCMGAGGYDSSRNACFEMEMCSFSMISAVDSSK